VPIQLHAHSRRKTNRQHGSKKSSSFVLDDEADLVDLTTDRLTKLGFPTVGTTSPQDALQKIRLGGCRAVIADFKMPAMDGLAFLEKVLQYDPGIYVILVTGYYSVDAAIDAIKRGAYDYAKPLDFARLAKTLDDLAELFTQRSQIRDLEDRLLQNLQFHGIVGRSPAMFEVFDLAKKVSRHYSNVLITGPTGSGKELIARAVHHMSPVGQERFAVCNCSALVDSFLKASFSVTSAVRLLVRLTRAPVSSSMPITALCSSSR
jgi:DNA-binding NtrC family response regulator